MILTCTILTLRPVSLAKPSLTFLQGLGLISKEALKALLCWVVRMVLGRLGPFLPSFLPHVSSPLKSSQPKNIIKTNYSFNLRLITLVSVNRCITNSRTLWNRSKHFQFLFVIGPAEQLTLFNDELIALLQLSSANDALETAQVEQLRAVRMRPHDHLSRANSFGTA